MRTCTHCICVHNAYLHLCKQVACVPLLSFEKNSIFSFCLLVFCFLLVFTAQIHWLPVRDLHFRLISLAFLLQAFINWVFWVSLLRNSWFDFLWSLLGGLSQSFHNFASFCFCFCKKISPSFAGGGLNCVWVLIAFECFYIWSLELSPNFLDLHLIGS